MRRAKNLLIVITVFLAMFSTGQALAQAEAPAETKEKVAWHSHNYFGAGAQVSFPRSSYGNSYTTGFGMQGMFDYPLIPLLDICGSVGWNHFPHVDDGSTIDVWETALGLRFVLGAFFMNGEMGHFSKVDESSFIPGLGMRYDHWEFSFRSKATGSSTWSTFRVGYYF